MSEIKKHRCEIPNELYNKDIEGKYNNGNAVEYCYEDENDNLVASNGEYSNKVNFCPFCGYKSKKFIDS